MHKRITQATLLLAALSAAATAVPVHASQIAVQPIQVHLSKSTHSAVLTISNESAEPARVQATAFAWSQRPDGTMALTPTDDVIFFPQLLTIASGEKRSLRIATTASVGSSEKTYRIFVEELPSLQSQLQPGSATLMVRTKLGIPIFLDPVDPVAKPAIVSASLHNGNLAFVLGNEGTQHFVITGGDVTGVAQNNAAIFRQPLTGWYVLAGGRRTFSIPLRDCSKLTKVDVRIETSVGSVTKRIVPENGECTK